MYPLSHVLNRAIHVCLQVLLLSTCLTLQVASAAPIDEFRLSDIEQKIRDLETTTREQARLISQLQSQTPGMRSTGVAAPSSASSSSELRWINAASWNRLKPGMSELQVVEILGAPTQMRSADNQSRQLLYALEIGRSGYLTGRVTISKGTVTAIEIPTLK